MSTTCIKNLGKRYLNVVYVLSLFVRDITMEAREKPRQKVYLFEKDHDMIKELVRRRRTEETGGDLFGLWTNDGEAVVHIVTGQGIKPQIQRAQTDYSSKTEDSVDKLNTVLRKKFHLSYIGQWQYKCRTKQTENAIVEAVGQERLRQSVKCQDFVLIMADNDELSDQVHLSPYFLSVASTVMDGEGKTIPGESVFRSDDDVKHMVDALIKKGDLKAENESNPYNLRSKKEAHGITDEGKNEALSTDVEMKDESSHFDGKSSWPANPITLPRLQTDFACNQRDFKVYLFEEDRKIMEDLVLSYQEVETGGDLFGLWTTEGDAVLHIVLGPGKNCRRTDVSFYQDIPYLQRNGELLTQKYMLCHIGEWHSHHRLRLFEPSQGDSSTVIRNYPSGTCGFLLIIANIVSPTRVEFSPYLYTSNSSYRVGYDQKGELVVLSHPNAFKKDAAIQRSMENGKETKINYQYTVSYQGSTTHYPTRSKETSSYSNKHSSATTGAPYKRQSKNKFI